MIELVNKETGERYIVLKSNDNTYKRHTCLPDLYRIHLPEAVYDYLIKTSLHYLLQLEVQFLAEGNSCE